MTARPHRTAAVAVLLGSCAQLPYQPEELALPPAPSAFATVAEAIAVRFPRLVVCELAAHRLQSDWVEVDDGAVPGRRRVTVFPAGADRVGIVVELVWLRLSVTGSPSWSTPVGDRETERQLADLVRERLAAAFGAPPP